MPIPSNIKDREFKKFTEVDGETAVRTTSSGTFTYSGLSEAGVITMITLNSTTWTKITPSPLVNRNAVNIQNQTGTEIKINYSNTVSGYVGISIPDKGERFYDIQGPIDIWAKTEISTGQIAVEELA